MQIKFHKNLFIKSFTCRYKCRAFFYFFNQGWQWFLSFVTKLTWNIRRFLPLIVEPNSWKRSLRGHQWSNLVGLYFNINIVERDRDDFILTPKFVKEFLRNIFKLRTTVIDYAVAIFRAVVKFHLSCFIPSGLYLFHNHLRPLTFMEMHDSGTPLKSYERFVHFFRMTKWYCRACFCKLGKAVALPLFKAFSIFTRNTFAIMSFLQRAIPCYVDSHYPQRLHTKIKPNFGKEEHYLQG